MLRLGVFTYWDNSYWGGAVAAFGGALVFGALPRVRRRQKVRDAILMGLGLAILANSRPYEGLFYSIPFLFASLAPIFRRRSVPPSGALRKIFLPLCVVMALTFAMMAYYFWRTTGCPWRPPYMVDLATYIQEPKFIFQSLAPPKQYHHQVFRQFYGGYHVAMFVAAKHAPIISAIGKLAYFWIFFIGVAFTSPFFLLAGILPFGMRVRNLGHKTLFFLLVIGTSLAGILPLPYFSPHYAAPMACVVYALVLQALRRIWIWDRSGRRRGVAVVRATVGICLLTFSASAIALASGVRHQRLFPQDPIGPNFERSNIIDELRAQGGKHLIVVRYSPEHDGHHEWVYNDADIDNATVVWAREMGGSEDKSLLEYFKDRHVWLLEADAQPPRLLPINSTQTAESIHGITNH